ncbi:unnamed protein product [Closterium sp. Naga37s-1]|nr:unnamed protein product [Closterium sp. Naga37s-1]
MANLGFFKEVMAEAVDRAKGAVVEKTQAAVGKAREMVGLVDGSVEPSAPPPEPSILDELNQYCSLTLKQGHLGEAVDRAKGAVVEKTQAAVGKAREMVGLVDASADPSAPPPEPSILDELNQYCSLTLKQLMEKAVGKDVGRAVGREVGKAVGRAVGREVGKAREMVGLVDASENRRFWTN